MSGVSVFSIPEKNVEAISRNRGVVVVSRIKMIFWEHCIGIGRRCFQELGNNSSCPLSISIHIIPQGLWVQQVGAGWTDCSLTILDRIGD